MPLLCYLVNSLCCLLYKRDFDRISGITDLKAVQEKKLIKTLSENKMTKYGLKYDFAGISSGEDYRTKVPLTTYEDYSGYVEEIKSGQKNILTTEDVLLLEVTSGSSSASKLIPYTRTLKMDFQSGLRPWLYDLYAHKKGIKNGKSYWSVTPAATKKQVSSGGIPIGFDDDGQYFSKIEEKLFNLIFAVNGNVVHSESMQEFYFKTAVSLLKCRNLTLISVWNPTYFLLILDYMKENAQVLLPALSAKRRNEIEYSLLQQDYSKIWAGLRLISCWADANAKPYADKLQSLFPDVDIQPKGLLATEGFLSFPVMGGTDAILSVFSHFFEFISLKDDKVCSSHELVTGEQYEAVITTSGGLYRYRMNDVVEITGSYRNIPTLTFIGKRDLVCDLFGEKLNAIFVKNTIDSLDIKMDFYMVAPSGDRYVLFVKTNDAIENPDIAFRENFHYDYCRKLGQLKQMKIFRLTGNPVQEYLEECVRRGQKLGDIKPTVLHTGSGWEQIFKGEFE